MKTNNSMNIQNGVSSVPVYQRWYSSPKMVQAANFTAIKPPTYTSIQLAIAFLKVYEKLLVEQWPQLMLK